MRVSHQCHSTHTDVEMTVSETQTDVIKRREVGAVVSGAGHSPQWAGSWHDVLTMNHVVSSTRSSLAALVTMSSVRLAEVYYRLEISPRFDFVSRHDPRRSGLGRTSAK